jgi:hypothetical protein
LLVFHIVVRLFENEHILPNEENQGDCQGQEVVLEIVVIRPKDTQRLHQALPRAREDEAVEEER